MSASRRTPDIFIHLLRVGDIQGERSCPICQDSFTDSPDGAVRTVSCGHDFHLQCLSQWIFTGAPGRNTCPSCRGTLFADDPGENPVISFDDIMQQGRAVVQDISSAVRTHMRNRYLGGDYAQFSFTSDERRPRAQYVSRSQNAPSLHRMRPFPYWPDRRYTSPYLAGQPRTPLPNYSLGPLSPIGPSGYRTFNPPQRAWTGPAGIPHMYNLATANPLHSHHQSLFSPYGVNRPLHARTTPHPHPHPQPPPETQRRPQLAAESQSQPHARTPTRNLENENTPSSAPRDTPTSRSPEEHVENLRTILRSNNFTIKFDITKVDTIRYSNGVHTIRMGNNVMLTLEGADAYMRVRDVVVFYSF